MLNKIKIQDISHALIILSILTAVLHFGQALLKPIAFAVILSILLRPVCVRFERLKIPSVFAILLTFLIVFIIIGGIFTLFSTQLFYLFQDLKVFGQNITLLIENLQEIIYRKLPVSESDMNDLIVQGKAEILSLSGALLAPTLGASGSFLASAGLTLVYTFFFLLYRKSIQAFLLMLAPAEGQENARSFLMRVNQVLIRYFMGLLSVIGIMGILNSVGLWMIGVEHALLFGFFAAFLTIIPYLGTWVGGVLPVLYVLMNTGDIPDAIYVAIWFIIVQALESNIITPRIIGNQVSVNALFAFMALIAGGLLWGIAGMILFIPFTAVIKIICDHTTSLRGLGLLLGSEFSSRTTHTPENFSENTRRFFDE